MLATDDLDVFAEVFVADDLETLESPEDVNHRRSEGQTVGADLREKKRKEKKKKNQRRS